MRQQLKRLENCAHRVDSSLAIKSILVSIVAAVVLVGCGESQQSAPAPEAKPVEPVAEVAQPEPPTTEAPDISIHEAVAVGNIEAVKQHLAAGTDVNAKGPAGGTLLHVATAFGRKEMAEQLIAAGAEVNAKNNLGGTPLFGAAIGGQKDVVEQLIAAGADVNVKDVDGTTPLHYAAVKGHKEIVELLIEKDSDVNTLIVSGVHKGQTPLDSAIEFKQTEIADLLRKHGGKTGEELNAEGK